MVNSGTFSDILSQAEQLVSDGYDRAAAVVAGVVLETHLRKLSELNNVPIVKENGQNYPADFLNRQLSKDNLVYNKTTQKGVTRWLGIRNDAAHSINFGVDTKSVELMIEEIENFINNNPG